MSPPVSPLSTDLRVLLQDLTDEARRLSRDPAAPGPEAILGGLIDPLPLAALVADNEGHYVAVNPEAFDLSVVGGHQRLMRAALPRVGEEPIRGMSPGTRITGRRSVAVVA